MPLTIYKKLKENSCSLKEIAFDTIMSLDVAAGNDMLRQQRLANITCFKYGQKGHHRKHCPNSPGTHSALDQNIPGQTYRPPTTVTQTVTTSYTVPQSSLVTILKQFARAKQMNHQLRKHHTTKTKCCPTSSGN